MKTLKEQIEEMILAGQVNDEQTERELRTVWAAILKLAEAIDDIKEE